MICVAQFCYHNSEFHKLAFACEDNKDIANLLLEYAKKYYPNLQLTNIEFVYDGYNGKMFHAYGIDEVGIIVEDLDDFIVDFNCGRLDYLELLNDIKTDKEITDNENL